MTDIECLEAPDASTDLIEVNAPVWSDDLPGEHVTVRREAMGEVWFSTILPTLR